MTNLDGRQASLFKPETSWLTPLELPDLTNYEAVSFDSETSDPHLKELGAGWCRNDGYIVGVSMSWPQEGKAKALYAPFRHAGGDNLPPETVISWLNHFFKNFKGVLVLMNGMYDLGWLLATGIDISRVMNEEIKLWDVMFTEALLDENRRSYNLNSIAETHGFQKKNEGLLNEAAYSFGVDPKSGLWRLPARYVGPYAETDAKLPLLIYYKQRKLIKEYELERVHELEHSLVPCLLAMKRRGVRVDVDKAKQHRDMFMKEYNDTLVLIKGECGLPLEIFSADSVAKGFDQLSITYPKTKTGKPSFTDAWLTSHPSKMAKMVTHARKQHKAASAFCEGMVLNKHHNGRVHCDFNPLRSDDGGTVSGRFSSSNPNLQQVPARDPKMGTMIRGLFLPEEGEMWAAVDWSQQEPRLTVHYAEERGCSRGAEAAEKYRNDPDTDYHNFVASLLFGKDFTKQQRTIAKTINLGLAYGMGGAKLCRSLGLPTKMWETSSGRQVEVAGDEGQDILNKYHAAVPFIKELSVQYTQLANEQGALRTMSGRLIRFPFWESQSGGRAMKHEEAVRLYGSNGIRRAYTHAALNKKIQGGSADAMKISMRNLYREGVIPLVTVHDENGLSVASKKKAHEAAEIMRSCIKLRVPLKTDIDVGPSWGEAKPITEEE